MAKRGGNGFMNDVFNGLLVGAIGGVALSQLFGIGTCNPLAGIMDGDINWDCLNPLSLLPSGE